MKKIFIVVISLFVFLSAYSAEKFITFNREESSFPIVANGKVVNIIYDNSDQKGISIAINNLVEDFYRVCGMKPVLLDNPAGDNCIIRQNSSSRNRTGIANPTSFSDSYRMGMPGNCHTRKISHIMVIAIKYLTTMCNSGIRTYNDLRKTTYIAHICNFKFPAYFQLSMLGN